MTPPPGPAAASVDVHQSQTPPRLTWGWRGSPSPVGRGCISETKPSGLRPAPRTPTCFPCPCKPMVFPKKMVWKLPKCAGGELGRGFTLKGMPHAGVCGSRHAATQQARCHSALRRSRCRSLSHQESDGPTEGGNPTSPRGTQCLTKASDGCLRRRLRGGGRDLPLVIFLVISPHAPAQRPPSTEPKIPLQMTPGTFFEEKIGEEAGPSFFTRLEQGDSDLCRPQFQGRM